MCNVMKFLASYPVMPLLLNILLSWMSIIYLERYESKQPWTDYIIDAAEEKHNKFVILASVCVCVCVCVCVRKEL
jgi:hypothetical protein